MFSGGMLSNSEEPPKYLAFQRIAETFIFFEFDIKLLLIELKNVTVTYNFLFCNLVISYYK